MNSYFFIIYKFQGEFYIEVSKPSIFYLSGSLLSKQIVSVMALSSLTNDSHHITPRLSEVRIQICKLLLIVFAPIIFGELCSNFSISFLSKTSPLEESGIKKKANVNIHTLNMII